MTLHTTCVIRATLSIGGPAGTDQDIDLEVTGTYHVAHRARTSYFAGSMAQAAESACFEIEYVEFNGWRVYHWASASGRGALTGETLSALEAACIEQIERDGA